MTQLAVGRNVRVEVGLTEGTAKAVSALTSANPGVATATAHGFSDGTVGYFAAANGMETLLDMAFIVDAPATNTFTLENLDTTGLGTFTAGSAVPIATWATLSKATEYNISGGEATPQDTTVLLDQVSRTEPGAPGVQNCTFNFRAETEYQTALTFIETAARKGDKVTFRITLKDGARRVFRGTPSMPTESLTTGGIGAGSFSVAISGFFVRGAAA